MFISFDKTLASEHGPDTAESIGNLLSYPVNRGFSSLVAVKTLGHKSDPFFFYKNCIDLHTNLLHHSNDPASSNHSVNGSCRNHSL